MSIFELREIARLTLSPSRSFNNFNLALDLDYCSSTLRFCSLNSAVYLSSRKHTSVSSSAILSFSFNALSLFYDPEPDDNTLKCLLDHFDDTLPYTLDLFDFASMAASLSFSTSLIQPWIFSLNCSMLASISSYQFLSLSCCTTGNEALYYLCTPVTILNGS